MSDDWFAIAYINDEAILHGRKVDQSMVYVPLNEEQRRALEALESRHEVQMQTLLRSMAS